MALQRRRRERGRELSLFEDWLPSLGSWMRLDELIRDPEGRHLIRVEEFAEDGELVVRAELPGIDPDKDVEVTVDEGVLTISAERTEEEKEERRDFHRRELRYGSFARRIVLPEGVDEDAVRAEYRNGILEVRAPMPQAREETAEKRRIPISRG